MQILAGRTFWVEGAAGAMDPGQELVGLVTERPRSQCGQSSDQGVSRGLRAQEGTRSQITGGASPVKTVISAQLDEKRLENSEHRGGRI